VPTPGDGFSEMAADVADEEANIMDDKDYGMLKLHAHHGAQRQADGASLYAENLRYDYLEGKGMISMPESLGARYIQGPHPHHGSPDGK
jgi:hypothetical protein